MRESLKIPNGVTDDSNKVTVFYDLNLNLDKKIRILGKTMVIFLILNFFLYFSFSGFQVLFLNLKCNENSFNF